MVYGEFENGKTGIVSVYSEQNGQSEFDGVMMLTSSYTRNKSFAGSSLPAETKALRTDGPTDRRTNGPTDRRTNGRTHPLIESWLTTKNGMKRILQ